jgi:hypothetical protein
MNCASAAVHPREPAAKHGEARAGQLGAGGLVEPAVALAERDVVARLELEAARLADALDLDVGRFVAAFRHAGLRQVRHAKRDRIELGADLVQPRLPALELLADAGDFRHQLRHVLAPRLGHADGLGAGVALVLQVLGARLQCPALGLQRLHHGDVEVEAAGGFQAGGGFSQRGAQLVGVEHGYFRQKTRDPALSPGPNGASN